MLSFATIKMMNFNPKAFYQILNQNHNEKGTNNSPNCSNAAPFPTLKVFAPTENSPN